MQELNIKLEDIKKSYKKPVLQGINLEIKNESYIAIVGKSGSGKSTLMNILGLVEGFDSGTYYFNGVKIKSGKDYAKIRREKIGFIFQSYNLIPTLTCKENILLPALYAKKTRVDVNQLIKKLELEQLVNYPVNILSGGEKQRVGIARALILDPMMIIADEPTGNLDQENRRIVFELLRNVHNDGKAIVMITHDADTAQQAKVRYRLEKGLLNYEI